jgi:hypothetical protein
MSNKNVDITFIAHDQCRIEIKRGPMLLPIPHLHNWRKMGIYLINFNKGEDDEGCLKFCNILKWNATV